MNLTQKLDQWAYAHHPRWIDLLRITLGVILFIKGIFFISNSESIVEMLKNGRFEWISFALAHYVAFAHLVGGVMITIGLFTRFAVAFQIPVLLGAVIFVNSKLGFFSGNTELLFSIVILFMLVFFFIYGSGPASADQALENERREEKG
ncbi:MAG: DoxX family protein [Bacteroidota bacterium]